MKSIDACIDEVAPYMCYVCDENKELNKCARHGDRLCRKVYEAAVKLCTAGYRKASDVIDALVIRLIQRVAVNNIFAKSIDYARLVDDIEELAAEIRKELSNEHL